MNIIEFNGLPGCGKSTCSSELISILTEKTGNVKSFDSFDPLNKKQLMIRALRYKAGRQFLLEIIRILIRTHLLFTADVAKRMIYCMAFIGYYYSSRQTEGYLIMDEGIIQGVVSALFNYNQTIPDFSGVINSLQRLNILFVYVDINPDEASERIKKRNTIGHGRCDDITDSDQRKQILRHQADNFRAINAVIENKEKLARISDKNDLQQLIRQYSL